MRLTAEALDSSCQPNTTLESNVDKANNSIGNVYIESNCSDDGSFNRRTNISKFRSKYGLGPEWAHRYQNESDQSWNKGGGKKSPRSKSPGSTGSGGKKSSKSKKKSTKKEDDDICGKYSSFSPSMRYPRPCPTWMRPFPDPYCGPCGPSYSERYDPYRIDCVPSYSKFRDYTDMYCRKYLDPCSQPARESCPPYPRYPFPRCTFDPCDAFSPCYPDPCCDRPRYMSPSPPRYCCSDYSDISRFSCGDTSPKKEKKDKKGKKGKKGKKDKSPKVDNLIMSDKGGAHGKGKKAASASQSPSSPQRSKEKRSQSEPRTKVNFSDTKSKKGGSPTKSKKSPKKNGEDSERESFIKSICDKYTSPYSCDPCCEPWCCNPCGLTRPFNPCVSLRGASPSCFAESICGSSPKDKNGDKKDKKGKKGTAKAKKGAKSSPKKKKPGELNYSRSNTVNQTDFPNQNTTLIQTDHPIDVTTLNTTVSKRTVSKLSKPTQIPKPTQLPKPTRIQALSKPTIVSQTVKKSTVAASSKRYNQIKASFARPTLASKQRVHSIEASRPVSAQVRVAPRLRRSTQPPTHGSLGTKIGFKKISSKDDVLSTQSAPNSKPTTKTNSRSNFISKDQPEKPVKASSKTGSQYSSKPSVNHPSKSPIQPSPKPSVKQSPSPSIQRSPEPSAKHSSSPTIQRSSKPSTKSPVQQPSPKLPVKETSNHAIQLSPKPSPKRLDEPIIEHAKHSSKSTVKSPQKTQSLSNSNEFNIVLSIPTDITDAETQDLMVSLKNIIRDRSASEDRSGKARTRSSSQLRKPQVNCLKCVSLTSNNEESTTTWQTSSGGNKEKMGSNFNKNQENDAEEGRRWQVDKCNNKSTDELDQCNPESRVVIRKTERCRVRGRLSYPELNRSANKTSIKTQTPIEPLETSIMRNLKASNSNLDMANTGYDTTDTYDLDQSTALNSNGKADLATNTTPPLQSRNNMRPIRRRDSSLSTDTCPAYDTACVNTQTTTSESSLSDDNNYNFEINNGKKKYNDHEPCKSLGITSFHPKRKRTTKCGTSKEHDLHHVKQEAYSIKTTYLPGTANAYLQSNVYAERRAVRPLSHPSLRTKVDSDNQPAFSNKSPPSSVKSESSRDVTTPEFKFLLNEVKGEPSPQRIYNIGVRVTKTDAARNEVNVETKPLLQRVVTPQLSPCDADNTCSKAVDDHPEPHQRPRSRSKESKTKSYPKHIDNSASSLQEKTLRVKSKREPSERCRNYPNDHAQDKTRIKMRSCQHPRELKTKRIDEYRRNSCPTATSSRIVNTSSSRIINPDTSHLVTLDTTTSTMNTTTSTINTSTSTITNMLQHLPEAPDTDYYLRDTEMRCRVQNKHNKQKSSKQCFIETKQPRTQNGNGGVATHGNGGVATHCVDNTYSSTKHRKSVRSNSGDRQLDTAIKHMSSRYCSGDAPRHHLEDCAVAINRHKKTHRSRSRSNKAHKSQTVLDCEVGTDLAGFGISQEDPKYQRCFSKGAQRVKSEVLFVRDDQAGQKWAEPRVHRRTQKDQNNEKCDVTFNTPCDTDTIIKPPDVNAVYSVHQGAVSACLSDVCLSVPSRRYTQTQDKQTPPSNNQYASDDHEFEAIFSFRDYDKESPNKFYLTPPTLGNNESNGAKSPYGTFLRKNRAVDFQRSETPHSESWSKEDTHVSCSQQELRNFGHHSYLKPVDNQPELRGRIGNETKKDSFRGHSGDRFGEEETHKQTANNNGHGSDYKRRNESSSNNGSGSIRKSRSTEEAHLRANVGVKCNTIRNVAHIKTTPGGMMNNKHDDDSNTEAVHQHLSPGEMVYDRTFPSVSSDEFTSEWNYSEHSVNNKRGVHFDVQSFKKRQETTFSSNSSNVNFSDSNNNRNRDAKCFINYNTGRIQNNINSREPWCYSYNNNNNNNSSSSFSIKNINNNNNISNTNSITNRHKTFMNHNRNINNIRHHNNSPDTYVKAKDILCCLSDIAKESSIKNCNINGVSVRKHTKTTKDLSRCYNVCINSNTNKEITEGISICPDKCDSDITSAVAEDCGNKDNLHRDGGGGRCKTYRVGTILFHVVLFIISVLKIDPGHNQTDVELTLVPVYLAVFLCEIRSCQWGFPVLFCMCIHLSCILRISCFI